MRFKMNILSKYKIVFIIFFPLTLFSCKKNKEETPIFYEKISSALTPYMFKNGSYWVYENDSTFALDSISLTSIMHDYFWQPPSSPGSDNRTKIEYYKINLHDFLSSHDYDDFLFAGIITRNGNENPTYGQPIFVSFGAIGSSLDGAYVWDTINSINIGGNVYTKVREMKIVSSEQIDHEFLHDTYLFYRDSIGIIKKVIDLGGGNKESWSLKRWKVNF